MGLSESNTSENRKGPDLVVRLSKEPFLIDKKYDVYRVDIQKDVL